MMSNSSNQSRQQQTKQYFFEKTAMFILVQIALGLDYLHQHDIPHLNLKPSLILMSKTMLVKLTSFGLPSSRRRYEATMSKLLALSRKKMAVSSGSDNHHDK